MYIISLVQQVEIFAWVTSFMKSAYITGVLQVVKYQVWYLQVNQLIIDLL